MAADTSIEWCDDTVNPWWGCVKVSPACAHCYAETMDRRGLVDGGGHWGKDAPRFIRVDKAIAELERIARRSDKEGRPRRVFIASMADVFEDRADLVEPRKILWNALHRLAGDKPRITPLLLTKRPDVMAAWAAEHGWPAGCWAGTTVEDQRRADERIPHLLRVPAAVRFLSCEPLLGAVDLRRVLAALHLDRLEGRPCDSTCPRCWGPQIHWVIAGGESGPGARPMHPDWARSLLDQCQAAGVPFFFKQWGTHGVVDKPQRDGFVAYTDGGAGDPHGGVWDYASLQADRPHVLMERVGKKRAGRLLDGRTWDETPG